MKRKRSPNFRTYRPLLFGILFGLIAGLVAGCAAPQATETATPPGPTRVEPTRAPLPTIIPSATRPDTSTPRPRLSSTPSASPTPPGGIIGLPVVSVDQRWTALTVRQMLDGTDTFVLKVTHLTDGKAWQIQPLAAKSRVYAGPVRFSKDNLFLYYTLRSNSFTACAPQSQPGGERLYRLDLLTGESEQISNQSGTAWLSLSPDDRVLALLSHSSIHLTLVDLPSVEVTAGSRSTIPTVVSKPVNSPRVLPDPLPVDSLKPPLDTGNIVWSPDGEELVYAIYLGDCRDEKNLTTAIVRVGLNGAQSVILPSDPRGLVPIRWTQVGLVVADKQGVIWQLDPQSGQVKAYATPTPLPPTGPPAPSATETPSGLTSTP
ncbi:MAG TPA: hypothetical protein VMT46_02140 [Anaerolineaceae bacterium]|nr:hypothetical protein [Anaerolineaceae bacterium]